MVLSVVLGVALVVTLMLSVLLHMPFAVSRYAHRKAESVAEVYRAESALLASLAGFPSGYFDSLPPVSQGELGPWGMWSTPVENGRLTLLVGMSRAKAPWPRYAEWADGAELYRQGLSPPDTSATPASISTKAVPWPESFCITKPSRASRI